MTADGNTAVAMAQRFHEAYERLAPEFGYKTREASAVPWEDVPENNRELMTAVCKEVVCDEIERLREADPFAPLQAWLAEKKNRSVQVYRDDGMGCSPWTCELSVNNKPVVTVHEYAEGDWQGPAFTIQKALRKFAAEATPA